MIAKTLCVALLSVVALPGRVGAADVLEWPDVAPRSDYACALEYAKDPWAGRKYVSAIVCKWRR